MQRKGFVLIELLLIPMILIGACLSVVMGVGWFINVYKLCKCDFESPYRAEVIRGVGTIVFPLGCVAGWLDIGDGPTDPNSM